MIRVSAAIAAVAILLSLLAHMLGIGLTVRVLPEPPASEPARETAPVSATFGDLATEVSESPEPETQQPVEPDRAPEVETSEALVAGSNPQLSTRPDAAVAEQVEPESAEPAQTGDAQSPVPPSGQGGRAPELAAQQPVETSPAPQPPQGAPTPPASQTPAQVTEPTSPADRSTETAAVQPAPATPAPAVTVVPQLPDGILPPQPEAEPEPEPESEPESGPEAPEAEADPDADPQATDLAVVSSPRPRAPSRRPTDQPEGKPEGESDINPLLQPPAEPIESPLTAYAEGRRDLVIRDSSGAELKPGFGGSGGAGNSNRTSYAGRVLVHLNRAPPVPVSARGWATVFFEINPDGTLAWVTVIDSSGSNEIDSAARSQVRAASPFPVPPGGRKKRLTFSYGQ